MVAVAASLSVTKRGQRRGDEVLAGLEFEFVARLRGKGGGVVILAMSTLFSNSSGTLNHGVLR